MSHETLSHMSQSSAPKRPEKSQEELRVTLETKLRSMKPVLEEGIKEYELTLKEGAFLDADGEPEGAGEARKEEMIKKLDALFGRAEKMKETLVSKEPLSQPVPELSVVYTSPDKTKETITIDLEAKLQEFLAFYQKTKLDLPPDFPDIVRDIWERNHAEMERAIEENGFDEVLVLPADIPLPILKEKMKIENGYSEGQNFTDGGSFAKAISQNADRPRIVLVHSTQNLKDREELKKTLNILGSDVNLNEVLSLEDYLVFQKSHFEKTGKHLDEDGWTWLATKSGARLVRSGWDSGARDLDVHALDLGYQVGSLGVHPSRCFF
jgi:hypothetical protein